MPPFNLCLAMFVVLLAVGLGCTGKKDDGCIKSGCSGEVCSDQLLVTPCAWFPHFACYGNARCERQLDGGCGFTETEELKRCLDGGESK